MRAVRSTEPPAPGFRPIRLLDIELSSAIPAVEARPAENGEHYGSAWCTARLHGVPLGMVDVRLADGALSADDLVVIIWAALRREIDSHLAEDGCAAVDRLNSNGISSSGRPSCEVRREAFLERPPTLSVVIPTRDRAALLARCVASITTCRYPPDRLEIVIVDNAPTTDATRAYCDVMLEHRPVVRYVREDRIGSASARNRGLEAATGEFVVFTDDDVLVDVNWLAEVARGFEAAPGVACVSGPVLPTELETPAQIWFEQYGGFRRHFTQRVYNLSDHRPAEPLYPYAAGRFGTGANMSFRRVDLQAMGGFDPALGNGTPALGGVDSEALLRTVLRGHTLVYQPGAVVRHPHHRTYEGLRRQVWSYGVGLTAYLAKTLLADPRRLPGFLREVPNGLALALGSSSEKNHAKRSDYPRELTSLERRGMLYGPIAYGRSRRRLSRARRPAQTE